MSTRLSKALLGLMAFLLLLPVTAQLQEASSGRDTIRVFAIDGAIGPATSDYLVGKLAEAIRGWCLYGGHHHGYAGRP